MGKSAQCTKNNTQYADGQVISTGTVFFPVRCSEKTSEGKFHWAASKITNNTAGPYTPEFCLTLPGILSIKCVKLLIVTRNRDFRNLIS